MLLRGVLLALLTFPFFSAQAAEVNLLGRRIELVIPAGYCKMGNHPADVEIVTSSEGYLGNSNQMLALFADCSELEEFRSGKRLILDNSGHISVVLKTKGQPRIFKDVRRADYIQKMRSVFRDSFGEGLKQAEDRARELDFEINLQKNLGILGVDSNGLYFGVTWSGIDEMGKHRQVVVVSGMTLVKELPITLHLFQAFTKSPDIRGLISRQKAALARFVHANN